MSSVMAEHMCVSTFVVPVLFFVLGGPPPAGGGDSKPVTLGRIISTWKDRQARAKTFDFVTIGTEFRSKRAITTKGLVKAGRSSDRTDISMPETSFSVKLRLAADDRGRVRFTYEGKSPEAGEHGYGNQCHIEVFDGNLRKTFFPVSNLDFPNAHIREVKRSDRPRHPQVLPILIVYRAMDNDMGVFDEGRLMLTEDKGVVDGRPCLILTHSESLIWVDPAKDFVPIRYHQIDRGVTERAIEIKYGADGQHGWVPISWNNVQLDREGAVGHSVAATVTKHKIGDPISDETFDLEYPPGTWVNDYTKNEMYILRKDGSRRQVRIGEYNGRNYQQLLENDPLEKKSGNSFRTLLVVNLILLLAIVVLGIYYYRVKLRRRGSEKPTAR